jgi:hypothetical protein
MDHKIDLTGHALYEQSSTQQIVRCLGGIGELCGRATIYRSESGFDNPNSRRQTRTVCEDKRGDCLKCITDAI